MNTQLIKEYIEFAVNNGYEIKDILYNDEIRLYNWEKTPWIVHNSSSRNIVTIITSKEFILCICKWLWKRCIQNWDFDWSKGIYGEFDVQYYIDKWLDIEFANITWYTLDFYSEFTNSQAIAIRDWTLDEFITKILWPTKQ